ncbi:MAG: carboxypeptidase-like regulatory domain-containing protein, partial [Candidatus Sulfotelmatobacter sp.]
MKLFWLLAAVLCGNVCRAQTSPSSDKPFQSSQHNPPARATSEPRATVARLTVTVTDENGVAVPLARIELQPPPPVLALRCETDFAGHCEFSNISSGAYAIEVEKIGFYAISQSDVQVGGTSNVDVTLTHQQEAREVVNVAESAPAIDPEQISSKEELTAAEIIDVPYPGAHDYRNGLIFIPGVTPDAYGLPHIAGAESYQTLLLLDGFNVTQPTNGQLVVRTSVESFRSIEVAASREPAEFGKGSGGVLALNTRMGDDHFHITSTDFTPGVQDIKGISIGQWPPIVTVSGPIKKGKAWYIDALDGEYDNNITKQLPDGADADHVWRVDNLAKLQSNLTTRNIVTLSFLSNYYHDEYDGLSVLQPQPSTPTDAETAYIGSAKDQYYFRGGALLESGFGVAQYSVGLTPQGTGSYIESPQGAGGNYYLNESALARRVQGIANLYLPARQ